MELALLKAVVMFRPIASISYGEGIFDAAAIMLFGVIIGTFLIRSATRKSIDISPVDLVIFAFAIWSVSCYIIYFEEARFREVAKLLIPLLSYTVVKNIVDGPQQYRALLFWMIVGFALPVALSVGLMLTGQGVDYVSYWTGVARWQGAYTGAHSMGHSVTLFLFVLVIYYKLRETARASAAPPTATPAPLPKSKNRLANMALIGLGALAIYCLYMSQVRSAILGLLVFALVYLFFLNRRLLIMGMVGIGVLATVTVAHWLPALLPEVIVIERSHADLSEAGSGRPIYWKHNLELFASWPIDRKLAGAGIGNRAETMHASKEQALDSHNDWLDLLLQTGAVGVLLYAMLQFLIFRSIRRMEGPERYLFLALFLAVNAMMFVSNSYVWRIQVSHLYFVTLAYIEIRGRVQRRTQPLTAPAQELHERNVLASPSININRKRRADVAST